MKLIPHAQSSADVERRKTTRIDSSVANTHAAPPGWRSSSALDPNGLEQISEREQEGAEDGTSEVKIMAHAAFLTPPHPWEQM
jgi:hypothetical protein